MTLFALATMGTIGRRHRGGAGTGAVAAFSASGAGWTATLLLITLSPPDRAGVWLNLKYAFISFAPVFVAWFVLDFTGRLPARSSRCCARSRCSRSGWSGPTPTGAGCSPRSSSRAPAA